MSQDNKTEKKVDDKKTADMVDFYQYQYKRRIWAAKVRRQKKG